MRRTAAAVALSLIESTDAFVQPVSMATNAAKVAASPADLDVSIASLAFELRVEMPGGNLSRAVLRTLESRLVNFGAFLGHMDTLAGIGG